MRNFAELGIEEPYIKALADLGIEKPTDIQVKAIPFLLEKGSDFVGQAQTGTGKTAAFGLPLLKRIDPENRQIQALILAPTRELCQQIAKGLFRFTKYLDKKIFTEAVYGGAKIDLQVAALERPTHIVVATPGRLLDLLDRRALSLSEVRITILDEADEMLSMGFKDELDAILNQLPTNRVTWLFSATIPKGIEHIIEQHMGGDIFRISSAREDVINRDISHSYVLATPGNKFTLLRRFLEQQGEKRGVIFCRTRIDVQRLSQRLLDFGLAADTIHGDLMQKEREKALRAFKKSRVQILVATDVAARGIDVDSLAYVVHYDLPEQITQYTHRSGRTARAGRKGMSVAFIERSELYKLQSIERQLNIQIEQMEL